MDRETVFRRRWLILAVLSLSLIVIGLDILIITIALPDIQTDLSAGATAMQWTVNAYTLGFGGLLLLAGGLADRFGRKRVLSLGLTLFLLFSLGATYAGSAEALIAFRAGMGMSSALIMPTTLAIIRNVFPPHEQSRAIALWTAAAGIGVPLGPVVGGVLLDTFWWGSVFLINIPVAGGALLAGAWLLPESRDERHAGLDLPGAGLSVAGLVALVYGLIQGPEWGWSAPGTWGLIAGGFLLLVGFAAWEGRTQRPMLDGVLFRNPRFTGPAISITCVAFTLFGALFLVTQYLQFALRLPPLEAGLRMLAICTLILTSALAPMVVRRLGLRATIAGGLAVIAAGAALLSTVDAQSEDRALVALGLLGLGLGLAMPPAADSILASSPAGQSGAGSAVTDTAMQVGGALGIAVMGSVLTTRYRGELPALDHLPLPAREAAADSLGGAHAVATRVGPAGDGLLTAADRAFEVALSNATLVGAAVAGAGALAAALVLPRHPLVPGSGPGEAAPTVPEQARGPENGDGEDWLNAATGAPARRGR
ncbi:MFS transporter [Streptomyces sp. DSM 44917]|uniref:MFS transporter n=1 Tax=Streptomyces boetiae TaxID=3075541 RepID=A0ABU2LDI4_9ACTN|nr:MFS transporter [Streptomyces sp. DSM 44917]MDT0309567.1 MFS transporter [Streptomyces sp. DSM 44917]